LYLSNEAKDALLQLVAQAPEGTDVPSDCEGLLGQRTREHHPLAAAKRIRTMGEEEYRLFQRKRGARSLDGLPAQMD